MDAVLGTSLGPRSGHTVLSLLHRYERRRADQRGAVRVPRGGMGAVTDAIAAAATRRRRRRFGCRARWLRSDARGRSCCGVRWTNGEEIAASAVDLERRPQAPRS